MKTDLFTSLFGTLKRTAIALLFLLLHDARAQTLPEPPPFRWLSTWKFNDTNFLSYDGYGPRASFGVQSIESFSGNAVKISGASALLAYNEVEDQGPTNITCDNGMIEMWLRPDWASADIGGSGPGTYARLIELGAYTQDASLG